MRGGAAVSSILHLTKEELAQREISLRRQYNNFKTQHLQLDMSRGKPGVQQLGIHGTHANGSTAEGTDGITATEMIKMTVGMNDVTNVFGVKAKRTDVFQQEMGFVAVAGVKEDQSFTGVNEMAADLLVTYIVKISKNTERIQTIVFRMRVVIIQCGTEVPLAHLKGLILCKVAFFVHM